MLAVGLAQHPDDPTERLVTGLSLSAWVAMIQGQPDTARPLLDQAEAESGRGVAYSPETWNMLDGPNRTHFEF